MRLARLAIEHRMDLEGHLVGQGSLLGLEDLPMIRFVGYIWWFFTQNADEKQREKFRAALWRPSSLAAEIPDASPWHPDNEMKAFASLKAETTA